MSKHPTTFFIQPDLWLAFEKKRLSDVVPGEKYGVMNKSRIINNLIKDLVEKRITIDLTTPINSEGAIQQGAHLEPETRLRLDEFLLGVRKEMVGNKTDVKESDLTVKNIITKLLEQYVVG